MFTAASLQKFGRISRKDSVFLRKTERNKLIRKLKKAANRRINTAAKSKIERRTKQSVGNGRLVLIRFYAL